MQTRATARYHVVPTGLWHEYKAGREPQPDTTLCLLDCGMNTKLAWLSSGWQGGGAGSHATPQIPREHLRTFQPWETLSTRMLRGCVCGGPALASALKKQTSNEDPCESDLSRKCSRKNRQGSGEIGSGRGGGWARVQKVPLALACTQGTMEVEVQEAEYLYPSALPMCIPRHSQPLRSILRQRAKVLAVRGKRPQGDCVQENSQGSRGLRGVAHRSFH